MEQWSSEPLFSPAVLGWGALLLWLLAALSAWRSRRQWTRAANLGALGLRTLVLGVAVFGLLRIEAVSRHTRSEKKALLVLTDASQSLLVRDELDAGGAPISRANAAQFALGKILDQAAARGWKIRANDAGEFLAPRSAGDREIHAQAGASALGTCLSAACSDATQAGTDLDTPVGAVVMLTDGAVNLGPALPDAARDLARKNLPFFAIALGTPHAAPPDAVLRPLTSTGTGALGNGLEGINVQVVRSDADAEGESSSEIHAGQKLRLEARAQRSAGGPALDGPLGDMPVRLWVSGPAGMELAQATGASAWPGFVEVAALRHRIAAAPDWTPVKFEFTPSRPGLYRLRLALDPLADEKIISNNALYAELEVLPPRRRLLFVASRLNHDYRALRALFSGWKNPEAEFVTDFVRPVDDAGHLNGPWPIEDALRRWLEPPALGYAPGATLVWLEPEPAHLSTAQQNRLAAALQSGTMGVIWLTSAPTDEFCTRFRGTSLEEFLPVMAGGGLTQGANPAQPLAGAQEARAHPATSWAWSDSANSDTGLDPWARLGSVLAPAGYVPRMQAQALLKSGGRLWLAASKAEIGSAKARVLWRVSGSDWRWLSATAYASGRGDAELSEQAAQREWNERAWERMARWTSGGQDETPKALRLDLSKPNLALGEGLRARVTLQAEAVGALRLEYRLLPVALDQAALAGTDGPVEKEPASTWRAWNAAEAGLGSAQKIRYFTGAMDAPAASGEWVLQVRALDEKGAEAGNDQRFFCVSGAPLEALNPDPDLAALKAATEAAQGSTNDPESADARPSRVFRPDTEGVQALLKNVEPFMKGSERIIETRAPFVSPILLWAVLAAALLLEIRVRRG